MTYAFLADDRDLNSLATSHEAPPETRLSGSSADVSISQSAAPIQSQSIFGSCSLCGNPGFPEPLESFVKCQKCGVSR